MCTNERSYQHRNRLQPARHPALTFYSVRLLRHASIPVPAPPPTHALTAPLVVLGARHADARKRVRARECGHATPRVERGVSGTRERERHLGREDRAEGRLQTVGEAGERCGLAGEEDVLRESQTVSVRSVSAVGWASGEERGVTCTSRPRSESEKVLRTFWRTSPSPAESTPAMFGANQASATRHRSVERWIRVLPACRSVNRKGC